MAIFYGKMDGLRANACCQSNPPLQPPAMPVAGSIRKNGCTAGECPQYTHFSDVKPSPVLWGRVKLPVATSGGGFIPGRYLRQEVACGNFRMPPERLNRELSMTGDKVPRIVSLPPYPLSSPSAPRLLTNASSSEVNSSGKMNLVAGLIPSDLSVSKYCSVIVFESIVCATS